MRSRRLVVVSQIFPWVTQSFTIREVSALRDEGLPLQVIAFRRPPEHLLDEQARALLSHTTFVADAGWTGLAGATARALVRRPVLVTTWLARAALGRGLLRTTRAQRGRGVLAVLRAAWIAERTPRADLYHADFADEAATAAMVVAELVRARFSFKSHASYNPQLLEEKAAAAAVVVTESMFDRRHYFAAVPDERVLVSRTGVDEVAPPRTGVGSPLRILCIGTLQEKKGQRYLIAAAALLRERGVPVRVHLVGSGPLESELHAFARAVAPDTVTFEPYVPHSAVASRYADHDVFVLPSVVTPAGDRDGLPAVLIEAAAAGCVVASTPVSGIPELIVDGETGLLAPERDAASLADALQRLVEDPELVQRLRVGAAELVRERFDLRRNAAELAARFRVELDSA